MKKLPNKDRLKSLLRVAIESNNVEFFKNVYHDHEELLSTKLFESDNGVWWAFHLSIHRDKRDWKASQKMFTNINSFFKAPNLILRNFDIITQVSIINPDPQRRFAYHISNLFSETRKTEKFALSPSEVDYFNDFEQRYSTLNPDAKKSIASMIKDESRFDYFSRENLVKMYGDVESMHIDLDLERIVKQIT